MKAKGKGFLARVLGQKIGAAQAADADETARGLAPDGRNLNLSSAYNLRELGGYETSQGTTAYGRLLRCGGTRSISGRDKRWLMEDYHLTHVLDLRGSSEAPELTDIFAHTADITWRNVSFYDFDLSHPALAPVEDSDNYLVGGYLRMLSNAKAVREIIGFLASVPAGECGLFHCAAGMDRTGMTALLVLGNAGASRKTIVADYCYSFASVAAVDKMLAGESTDVAASPGGLFGLDARREAVENVYDTILVQHGSMQAYLLSCGITPTQLDALNEHLLG